VEGEVETVSAPEVDGVANVLSIMETSPCDRAKLATASSRPCMRVLIVST